MKIVKSIVKTCFMVLLVVSVLGACKKKKNNDPVPTTNTETEEVVVDSTIYKVKIKATKVNTAPLSPALGKQSRMCFGNNKVYTFSRTTQEFKSYDLTTNTWKKLNYTNQLAFAGYTSKMIYSQGHSIYYLHDVKDIYYTSGYPDPSKREQWNPTVDLPNEYSSGESGYALYYTDIFSVGGRMNGVSKSYDIRKYSYDTDKWIILAKLPNGLEDANALVHDDKLYIIGNSISDGTQYFHGYIFDIIALTTTYFPLPEKFDRIAAGQYQFTAYQDYLFLNNGTKEFFVYNTKTKKWNNWRVLIEGDFLSGSVNLFVSESGKFYAAGEKDGNFALYELQVTFPEKELE